MLNHSIREEKRGEHACDFELRCVADFLLKEVPKIVENGSLEIWLSGRQN